MQYKTQNAKETKVKKQTLNLSTFFLFVTFLVSEWVPLNVWETHLKIRNAKNTKMHSKVRMQRFTEKFAQNPKLPQTHIKVKEKSGTPSVWEISYKTRNAENTKVTTQTSRLFVALFDSKQSFVNVWKMSSKIRNTENTKTLPCVNTQKMKDFFFKLLYKQKNYKN